MTFFVYLIVSTKKHKQISYVGYTNDINKRLSLHNSGKGAKFTRGYKWKLIYQKQYNNKKEAMTEEYKLKKNYKLRNTIKLNYKKKIKNNN